MAGLDHGIDDVSWIKAQCRGEAGQGAGEGVVCGCRGKIPLPALAAAELLVSSGGVTLQMMN